jgi:uncharacterized Zn finger protein
MVVELSYYEDLYAFSVSGSIILKDAVGLVEQLKLDGNEFITLVYGKTKRQKTEDKLSRIFRIYKIGDRKPLGNLNAEYVTLYFCSETLLLSEQVKISKGYVGKKIATSKNNTGIVNNILIEKLKVDPDKINVIEETIGTYDFVVPRLKPFEAISWLSTYARPSGNQLGADMVFFETKDGFNFRSLQSMLKQEPYATYKYQPKNLNFDNKSFGENIITVLDFELVKSFDALDSTNSGLYANRLISIDPTTKSYKVTNFSYESYAEKTKSKNGNPVIAPSTNALGVKQTEAYDSRLKVAFTNSNQKDVEYIKERQGSTAKDIYIETYVPNRTAQIALANYTVVKLVVPGDSDVTVGKTINFNFYSLQVKNARKLDEHFSGKYLITAVRHVIQPPGTYQTFIEMAKESTKVSYVQPDPRSREYKEAVNG